MSEVQFEENTRASQPFFQTAPKEPFLVGLVIKFKIAKDAEQANKVLIGMAICFFLLTLYVTKTSFFSTPSYSYQTQGGAAPVINPDTGQGSQF